MNRPNKCMYCCRRLRRMVGIWLLWGLWGFFGKLLLGIYGDERATLLFKGVCDCVCICVWGRGVLSKGAETQVLVSPLTLFLHSLLFLLFCCSLWTFLIDWKILSETELEKPLLVLDMTTTTYQQLSYLWSRQMTKTCRCRGGQWAPSLQQVDEKIF